MINYTSKEDTLKLINVQKKSLNATLKIQKELNKQILCFMKNFIGNVKMNSNEQTNNDVLSYLNNSTKMLSKSNKNIETLNHFIERLDSIYTGIENLNSEKKIKYQIEQYNKSYVKNMDTIFCNTSIIEKFIYDMSLIDFTEIFKEEEKIEENINEESSSTINSDEIAASYIENTLVISDIKGKIFLPYKIEKIKEILLNEKDKYSSIQEVIDKLYTISIKDYKVASVSRFKEAYNLITKKEHGSVFKAFSLGSELFFNYHLHPAIIRACNNLDELDIYLACLDDNTLEDFKFFDIKYEVPPVVVNTDKNTVIEKA